MRLVLLLSGPGNIHRGWASIHLQTAPANVIQQLILFFGLRIRCISLTLRKTNVPRALRIIAELLSLHACPRMHSSYLAGKEGR